MRMLSTKEGSKEWWIKEEHPDHQDLVLGSIRLEITMLGLKGEKGFGEGLKLGREGTRGLFHTLREELALTDLQAPLEIKFRFFKIPF